MAKKMMTLFSLLVIVTLLLAACAQQPAPTAVEQKPAEQEAQPAEQEQVTLKAIGFESCIMDGLKLQADAYMKDHPNVKVELEPTAYTNLHEKEVVELSSGTGTYDLYSIVTDWMPEYMTAGYLEPLNNYIEASPPEDWPNSWSDGLMELARNGEGTIYGIPHHDGPQMLYYRKDLFEDPKNQADFKAQYGYDLAPPETWDQFLDIAKFFTKPEEDMWGTVLTAKFGEQQLAHDFWFLLPSFGGEDGFDDKGYPTFNGSAGVNALQFYSDLINQHKVAPEASLTFGIPEAGDFYLSGKAAMHWNWSHIGAYAEQADKSKIVGKNGFALMPMDKDAGGQHPVYVGYWVLSVDKNSKNKQAAYDFISYVTDKEHDKLLAEVGCIPSRLSSWSDPELVKRFPFYEFLPKVYEGFVAGSPRVPEYEKLDDLMQRYMSQAISGETDSQSALDKAVEEMITVLKEAGHIQ